MKLRPFIRGIISYIPFLKRILKKRGTGGSNSARYCYSVWMRHLNFLYEFGMKKMPEKIGELGPGDSLGVGLAAMLSGVKEYYALDTTRHADLNTNVGVLNDLVDLYKKQERIPDLDEFPEIRPYLNNYDFPKKVDLDELSEAVSESRINKIKKDLKNPTPHSSINYIAPWDNEDLIEYDSLELILSQAVLEHVMQIEDAYKKMYKWLKPGGYISHIIDYRAHETHNRWYGHWLYNDYLWNIIMQGRKYPINRLPHSMHIKLIHKTGFEILCEKPFYVKDIAPGSLLNNKRITFTSADLKIASAHFIARKPLA